MKTFEFQGFEIAAEHVVAVGPVTEDAELGCPAFTVYLSGGLGVYFKEVKGQKTRRAFIDLWKDLPV